MDVQDGATLIRLARRAVETYLNENRIIGVPEGIKPELLENRGVFVTIHSYPKGNLRGCIGFPEPRYPLAKATVEAAISAATGDPRFHPLTKEELPQVVFEITVLTPPEKIVKTDPLEKLEGIGIGRDGLIIEKGWNKGLLLPQVPIEQGWNKEEYLEGLCMKAGLPPGSWRDEDCVLSRFEGMIFSEEKPGGEVKRKG